MVRAGAPLSALDGVLVGVKDEIDCLPYPTTGGTRWLGAARRCEADAACVAQLRACGAVLAGKANMHELGAGTSGINPHHGYALLFRVTRLFFSLSPCSAPSLKRCVMRLRPSSACNVQVDEEPVQRQHDRRGLLQRLRRHRLRRPLPRRARRRRRRCVRVLISSGLCSATNKLTLSH